MELDRATVPATRLLEWELVEETGARYDDTYFYSWQTTWHSVKLQLEAEYSEGAESWLNLELYLGTSDAKEALPYMLRYCHLGAWKDAQRNEPSEGHLGERLGLWLAHSYDPLTAIVMGLDEAPELVESMMKVLNPRWPALTAEGIVESALG